MLNNKELKTIISNISIEKNFDESMLEKDYYITVFFKELEKFENNWLVFKWWTCLNKVYFWYYRLSEDIDFSVTDSKSIVSMSKKEKSKRLNEIHEILDVCFEKIWFKENRERNIDTKWEYRCKHNNAQMMRLYYEKESLFWWIITIQIEISMRKNPYQPKNLKLQHLFFDNTQRDLINDWNDIRVLTYNINEVISEKLRCTYWRLWKDKNWKFITKIAIRDHFDIYYFLTQYVSDQKKFEHDFWFEWFESDIFMKLFLYKNLQDFKEKHISKDLYFEEEKNYIKTKLYSLKDDLLVVSNDEENEFFVWWIDSVLSVIQEMQTILKRYINKTYKLNFDENIHIDKYLEKLVELDVKINFD